jgi:uncharacterized repeat protein (TIGR03837 family)
MSQTNLPTLTAQPTLQWDVFCRVIDNFGDIGVCWRLASQLAQQGQRVRLWVDDASALAWMAPSGCPGVELRDWNATPPEAGETPTDVMVEAFGCEIAPEFIATCAHKAGARGHKPVWINLEYLSAERYVERNHRLPSLISHGPAQGWTRWFFYPGFTPATGGLLCEPDLPARCEGFDAASWRTANAHPQLPAHTAANEPAARWMSLFCYEPHALPQWLQRCQTAATPTHLLVAPGRPAQAVRQALDIQSPIAPQGNTDKRGQLYISYRSHCPQPAFDEMLWACDFNAVRGEDSLVRALWAGKALVWHIYPQDDDAHHAKLLAFLDWLQAPASMRQFHCTWNGLDTQPLQWPDDTTLREWATCVQTARARLLMQDNLVAQLLGFIAEKR